MNTSAWIKIEIFHNSIVIYSGLYSSCKSDPELDAMKSNLEEKIRMTNSTELDCINERLIADVLKQLKASKRDSVFDLCSGMFIHGPSELTSHLKIMIRTMISHGSVSPFLLKVMVNINN